MSQLLFIDFWSYPLRYKEVFCPKTHFKYSFNIIKNVNISNSRLVHADKTSNFYIQSPSRFFSTGGLNWKFTSPWHWDPWRCPVCIITEQIAISDTSTTLCNYNCIGKHKSSKRPIFTQPDIKHFSEKKSVYVVTFLLSVPPSTFQPKADAHGEKATKILTSYARSTVPFTKITQWFTLESTSGARLVWPPAPSRASFKPSSG